MSYTFQNLKDDVRDYTEVDSTVLTDALLTTMAKNAENRIYRDADSDDNRFYATSNLAIGNRYVTIPSDLRIIRYIQLTDTTVTPNDICRAPAGALQISSISASNTTTTYLSNKYEDLLLYATLVEAYGYLKGPADMLQYYEQSYQRALQTYAIEQQGRRRRDEYQEGVIRTPLKSPSP